MGTNGCTTDMAAPSVNCNTALGAPAVKLNSAGSIAVTATTNVDGTQSAAAEHCAPGTAFAQGSDAEMRTLAVGMPGSGMTCHVTPVHDPSVRAAGFVTLTLQVGVEPREPMESATRPVVTCTVRSTSADVSAAARACEGGWGGGGSAWESACSCRSSPWPHPQRQPRGNSPSSNAK